jgi:hypothetical protein
VIKLTFLILILLVSVHISFGQKCKNKSNIDERRICSHIIVKIESIETSELKGIVIDANEEAIPDSIVEVYEAKENGKLLAIYKTGIDGKFCIKKLPKGKYHLKVGWSRLGFN